MNHVTSNKLLSTKQYGFISGRSTTTQLLTYLDECIGNIVDGGVVDSIYFDFAKAFDTVPHRRLLGKLESYGIRGSILNWVNAFLIERSQVVKVNNTESKLAHVLSGVPQGSVLGPVLFVIYIHDLPETVQPDILLFADDTKVMRTITIREDSCSLQSDVDSLQQWLLNFNVDKCHVLTIGKFENIKYTHRYRIHECELDHVFEEKDLGVHIDAELKFVEHMSAKIKKANSIVGLIRRSFSYLDSKLFKKLYTTFVRPHVEYAQAVWSPHLIKHVNMIENVQKRTTKLVDELHDLDYPERQKWVDLPTLSHRISKHFRAYDKDIIPDKFQIRNRISRKHNYQLVQHMSRDGVRGLQSNSFYYRNAKIWNNLPKGVVDAKTINNFKQKLDKAWKDNPTKFNHIRLSDS